MQDLLNIRTLALLLGLTSAALAGILVYFSLNRRTFDGFRFWTGGYVAGSVGTILMSLRHILPDFATILAANLGILLLPLLVARGTALFLRQPQWPKVEAAVLAAVAAGFVYYTYIEPSVLARVEIISLAMALFYLRAAFIVLRHAEETLGSPNRFLASAFGLTGLWFLVRAVLTPLAVGHIADFMSAGLLSGASFLVLCLGGMVIAAGLVVISFRRLELEVARADQEIRTLSGLLPMCANCHKIRDDEGYWEGVEKYLSERTGAQLTHSICPECARKLYPELKLEKLR